MYIVNKHVVEVLERSMADAIASCNSTRSKQKAHLTASHHCGMECVPEGLGMHCFETL